VTVRNSERRIVHSGELAGSSLREAILANVPDAPEDAKVEVWVIIPSGGDYSGVTLEVNSDENDLPRAGDLTLHFSMTWDE
jgi:hypothetical protein